MSTTANQKKCQGMFVNAFAYLNESRTGIGNRRLLETSKKLTSVAHECDRGHSI